MTHAENPIRKLEKWHYLVIADEAGELLRYVYDNGHLGVALVGILRLHESFTDSDRPAGELEQLWSRVGDLRVAAGIDGIRSEADHPEGVGANP